MDEIISNALPEVVAPETADTSPAADTGVTQETPAPSEPAKPKQTAEDNAAFAAMRRALEAERKEKARLESLVSGFKSGLKPQGYDGNDEDIVAKLNAEAQGVSIDEYKAQMRKAEAERSKEADLKAKLEEYERKDQERQLADDLNAIKKAFPDVKASTVWELGDKYVALMRTGEVDAVTAYRAIREADVKPAPPSIGSVKSTAAVVDKEFYTKDELEAIAKNPDKLKNEAVQKKAWNSIFKNG